MDGLSLALETSSEDDERRCRVTEKSKEGKAQSNAKDICLPLAQLQACFWPKEHLRRWFKVQTPGSHPQR